jgi:AcrR family transcriptional regulator
LASPIQNPLPSETSGAKREKESPAYERIVAAAIEVFGTFGFVKATIQEIAARAHVSKPLFYRNFENKQNVFEIVVDRVFTEWRQALIDEVTRNEGDTAQALRILFLTALEYGRARPLLNRLLTRDSQLLLSTQSDVWDRACLALTQLIEQILHRGIEAGRVRSDLPVEYMADLLTEINFTYANRQLISGIAIEPDRAEALTACMLDGVMRHPVVSTELGRPI